MSITAHLTQSYFRPPRARVLRGPLPPPPQASFGQGLTAPRPPACGTPQHAGDSIVTDSTSPPARSSPHGGSGGIALTLTEREVPSLHGRRHGREGGVFAAGCRPCGAVPVCPRRANWGRASRTPRCLGATPPHRRATAARSPSQIPRPQGATTGRHPPPPLPAGCWAASVGQERGRSPHRRGKPVGEEGEVLLAGSEDPAHRFLAGLTSQHPIYTLASGRACVISRLAIGRTCEASKVTTATVSPSSATNSTS